MSEDPSRVVLDTNVVLDCFVFRDACAGNLMKAIEARSVHVLVHECVLDELQRVLTYAQFGLTDREQRDVFARYLANAISARVPEGFRTDNLLLPPGFPSCHDADDQPFLALAFHVGADALLTKDNAVLAMRKKARKFGVSILHPVDLHVPELALRGPSACRR